MIYLCEKDTCWRNFRKSGEVVEYKEVKFKSSGFVCTDGSDAGPSTENGIQLSTQVFMIVLSAFIIFMHWFSGTTVFEISNKRLLFEMHETLQYEGYYFCNKILKVLQEKLKRKLQSIIQTVLNDMWHFFHFMFSCEEPWSERVVCFVFFPTVLFIETPTFLPRLQIKPASFHIDMCTMSVVV